jgi:hypothetical protein
MGRRLEHDVIAEGSNAVFTAQRLDAHERPPGLGPDVATQLQRIKAKGPIIAPNVLEREFG